MDCTIEANLLASAFKAINEVDNECIVNFFDEGISVDLVDPANVMMIDLKLPHKEFMEYKLPDGEEQLGFDMTELLDTLSLCSKGELVKIWTEDGKLNFVSDSVNYTLPLLAINTLRAPPAIPHLVNDTIIETNKTYFSKAIKAVAKVDQHASMMCDDGEFLISAENQGKKMEVPGKDAATVLRNAPAESLFSIDYLQSVVKGCSGDELTLEIGNNRPLILTTKLGINGRIKILLAPRIEN